MTVPLTTKQKAALVQGKQGGGKLLYIGAGGTYGRRNGFGRA